MRLSRRFTGVLLVFALAGALAPTALAGKKSPAAPAPAPVVSSPSAPSTGVPDSSIVSMVDIEALK
jgi:hypothetical protein